MAVIYQVYPAYYATLQKEQGLSFSDIDKYSKQNRVYAFEIGKALKMQESGRSIENILSYFKTQGYNSTQLGEFNTVLSTPTVDATGVKKIDKFNDIVDKALKVGLGLASIATAFGFVKGGAVNQVQIPNFDPSQFTGTPQTYTYGIDTATNQILTQEGTTVPKPNVTPPNVSASGLPDWINTTTVLIFFGALVLIYLATNSGKQDVNPYEYSRRYR